MIAESWQDATGVWWAEKVQRRRPQSLLFNAFDAARRCSQVQVAGFQEFYAHPSICGAPNAERVVCDFDNE
jgi:hypothetical protein